MEISPAFGNPIILTRHSPITFSASSSSFSPSPLFSTRPIKNPHLTCATITTTATPPPPLNESTNSSNSNLVYSKARQSAIVAIQQSPDLDSALARLGGLLKTQDLNAVMRHFGKLNRLKELTQVFEWMNQNGKISAFSYSSYIKLMGKSLSPVKALEIYNSIKDESTRNHVSVCNSIISCLIRNGKLENSIVLFRQMKKDGLVPDIVTYSTLIAGCAKSNVSYSKALELIDELKQNGLQMDLVLYGTVLSVCASHNQLKDAEIYFKQMKDEGHTPNVFHYSSLLNAYAIDGDYKKAETVLQEMKTSGLAPNKVILTTLLKVYVRGGLFDKSRELLNELQSLGYAEDEVYVRGGLFDKSRELLNELQSLGYAEDEVAYCLLMDGLAKSGHMNEAKAVFEEMKAKNVRTDGYAHSIMISALCRCGSLDEAKQLAIDFETKYEKYDVVILNTMLCAYCRAGEMENVMKMMKKMDELAIAPDRNTFRILIKYFCKEKMYTLAYRTLADMHNKGHQPDEDLCAALMSHLGRDGAHSEAFCVYNILRYSKRTLSKAHHEKILEILIRGKHLKDAYVIVKDKAEYISKSAIRKFAFSFMKEGNINLINDVMKALHSSGYKIDQGVFETAILRYIEEPEKKDLLIKLLQWMPGQGYAVDSSTRNLLLKNSHLFGRQLIAEILSKQRSFLSKSSSTTQK